MNTSNSFHETNHCYTYHDHDDPVMRTLLCTFGESLVGFGNYLLTDCDPKYNIVTPELLNKIFPNGSNVLHVALYTCFDLFNYVLHHPFVSNETIDSLDKQGLSIFHHACTKGLNVKKSIKALDYLFGSNRISSEFIKSLNFENLGDTFENQGVIHAKNSNKTAISDEDL